MREDIFGWMIFDESDQPETFKIEKGVSATLVFKTLKQAQKYAKKDYKVTKARVKPRKYNYNMNISGGK